MTLAIAQTRTWTRDGDSFLTSTDRSLISLEALNNALESPELDWAKRLPSAELKTMVESSMCFGVYKKASQDRESPEMIGFARIITDYVTLAYLTDVYVLPDYQGLGLGSWLLECVDEWVDSMPFRRQLVFLAHEGKKENYYAKKLGTSRMEEQGTGYRFVNRKGTGTSLGSD